MSNCTRWLGHGLAVVVLLGVHAAAGAQTLEQRRVFTDGHDRGVSTLAFSPDGKVLVSGGGDQVVLFHDAVTGKKIGELTREGKSPPRGLVISPDGQLFAFAEDAGITLLRRAANGDWTNWENRMYLKSSGPVHSLALGAGRRTHNLFAADGQQDLLQWTITADKATPEEGLKVAGEPTDRSHNEAWAAASPPKGGGSVAAVVGTVGKLQTLDSTTGATLVTFSVTARLVIHNVSDGKQEAATEYVVVEQSKKPPTPRRGLGVAFAPGGQSRLLVNFGDGVARVVDFEGGRLKPFAELTVRDRTVESCAFLAEGRVVVGAVGKVGEAAPELWVWKLTERGAAAGKGIKLKNAVAALAVSPDGKLVAVGDVKGEITLLEVKE